jgi:sporulation protein YlmC with PRC-barrel domain
MRATDLHLLVRSRFGKRLGHVHEIHIRDGRVVAFTVGPKGFLQRLGSSRAGKRIAWENVERISPDEIIVDHS